MKRSKNADAVSVYGNSNLFMERWIVRKVYSRMKEKYPEINQWFIRDAIRAFRIFLKIILSSKYNYEGKNLKAIVNEYNKLEFIRKTIDGFPKSKQALYKNRLSSKGLHE